MTKYCMVWGTWTTTAKFPRFFSARNVFFAYFTEARSSTLFSFATGDHLFWLLFKRTRQNEDGMTSLIRIIPSILLPRAECLEYIPCIPELEERLNQTVVWVYSVYSYSRLKSIERTLKIISVTSWKRSSSGVEHHGESAFPRNRNNWIQKDSLCVWNWKTFF